MLINFQGNQAGGDSAPLKLMPCPDSPNCVSSLAQNTSQKIAPLTYSTTSSEAREKILDILHSTPRTKVVVQEKSFIHAEVSSAFFGFIDDMQFFLDEKNKTLHMRSGSRTGYWDFGKNRSRVEEFRARFDATSNDP